MVHRADSTERPARREAFVEELLSTVAIYEPFSNLDSDLRAALRAELRALQHLLALTTIYVTHDIADAEVLAIALSECATAGSRRRFRKHAKRRRNLDHDAVASPLRALL